MNAVLLKINQGQLHSYVPTICLDGPVCLYFLQKINSLLLMYYSITLHWNLKDKRNDQTHSHVPSSKVSSWAVLYL